MSTSDAVAGRREPDDPGAGSLVPGGLVLGIFAGAILGLIDAADTLLGGFGPRAPADAGLFVLGAVVLLAALGAGVGALVAVGAGAAARRGASWHPTEGLTWGRRRLAPAALLMLSGAAVLALLLLGMALLLGSYPFGVSRLPAIAVALFGGGASIVVGGRLARRSPALAAALWVVCGAALYFLAARMVFQFSKLPPMSYVHVAKLFILYGFVMVALVVNAPRLSRRLRAVRPRAAGVLLVAAVLALAGARPVLETGSNQLQLALFHRTSLTFRVLGALPAEAAAAAEMLAATDDDCPPALVPLAAPAVGTAQVRGVLLILVDSLRADRVTPELTPNLIALGESGAWFERAYTTTPATFKAFRAMMTGRFEIGVQSDEPVEPFVGTLLNAAGVTTIAISAHANLELSTYMFDVYEQVDEAFSNRSSLSSEATTSRTLARLDQLGPDERFLLVSHYYDPHAHYVKNDLFWFGRSETSRYDAEVAYTDHWIGRLFDELDQRGLTEEIAVIVVSDHGEEFWDHRYMRHQLRMYEESSRVPLAIRIPGAQPRRITRPVSVLDLAPTLLDLFGVERPAEVGGVSLEPLALGEPADPPQPVFMLAYDDRAAAVVRGDTKLILNRASGVEELYDLAADPGERANLADEHEPAHHELHCLLLRWLDELGQ